MMAAIGDEPKPTVSQNEEDVGKLCEQTKNYRREELNSCYAMFTSNENRAFPIWRQKIEKSDDAVVWDYHVEKWYVSHSVDEKEGRDWLPRYHLNFVKLCSA